MVGDELAVGSAHAVEFLFDFEGIVLKKPPQESPVFPEREDHAGIVLIVGFDADGMKETVAQFQQHGLLLERNGGELFVKE